MEKQTNPIVEKFNYEFEKVLRKVKEAKPLFNYVNGMFYPLDNTDEVYERGIHYKPIKMPYMFKVTYLQCSYEEYIDCFLIQDIQA